MPTYLDDLDWMNHPEHFDEYEQKILKALSNERWAWMTVNGLRKAVNLRESEFSAALTSLMRDGIVRGGVNRDWTEALLVSRNG